MLNKLMSHENKKKPEEASKPVVIGMIDMVNPEQRFVLIRMATTLAIPPGTELSTTTQKGEAVKLKVSPEHKGSFLTADILSGNPERQNVVLYQPPGPQPATPGSPALPGAAPLPPPNSAPAALNELNQALMPIPLQPSTPQPSFSSPSPLPVPPPPAGEPNPSEFLRPVPTVPPQQ